MLVLAIGASSVVHAAEPTGSSVRILLALGCDASSNRHQLPSDGAKGTLHHHGGCHGHHIGVSTDEPAVPPAFAFAPLLTGWAGQLASNRTLDDFLRPPIA